MSGSRRPKLSIFEDSGKWYPPRTSSPLLEDEKQIRKEEMWTFEGATYRLFTEALHKRPIHISKHGFVKPPKDIISCHLVKMSKLNASLELLEPQKTKFSKRLRNFGRKIHRFFRLGFFGALRKNICKDSCVLLNCQCRKEKDLLDKSFLVEQYDESLMIRVCNEFHI